MEIQYKLADKNSLEISRIYQTLYVPANYYPHFNDWFNKVVYDESRKIFLATDADRIVGVSIIKDSLAESKLSTFFIANDYQNNGIGSKLMKYTLQNFVINKVPLVTMPESILYNFKHLIEKFKFYHIGTTHGQYQANKGEYYFRIEYNI